MRGEETYVSIHKVFKILSSNALKWADNIYINALKMSRNKYRRVTVNGDYSMPFDLILITTQFEEIQVEGK